ncbi:(4Fe-4S)-binding protein, partial [Fervidicella metallireducens AeB]
MNIGILSGKGGTGKTTVSTNLALTMKANYIDCDVEEPNGFIFLNPKDIKTKDVGVDYPFIDKDKCSLCGECVKACQFNALAKVKESIILFDKLCHGCAACQIVCKYNAIEYKKRKIGIIEEGHHKELICKHGILDIGEPMAVPILKELLKGLPEGVNILDCSPGTSCNVVNTLHHMDVAVLVTEPTEFGLHDLKMAVELVRIFNIPFGIIINKHIIGSTIIQDYCEKENIPLYGVIPYSREAAKAYSNGNMLVDLEEYKDIFEKISEKG